MTLAQHAAAKKARIARIRAEFAADAGLTEYYAQSAATEVVNAFRRGDYVEIKA